MDTADHRTGPRKRGDELQHAIFAATLAELQEHGYPQLTMDRVATRARTSKASLYRRWPNKAALALDALLDGFPDAQDLPDTGELRGDLAAVLRRMASVMTGTTGEVIRSILMDNATDPEVARSARALLVGRRHVPYLAVLRRWADRGVVRPDALTERVASVGPALLREHFFLHRVPAPDEVIDGIVEEVLLPLVSSR
ncbi:MAG TPA: TetR/AcrR family transcriptional regulator [Pseudonocardiaceae bacterium]